MSAVSSALTPEELAMAQQLVKALSLEDIEPASIAPDAMLFGNHVGGLGLDSIDALEIALMIQQQYGVELRSDDPQAREAFKSVRDLTRYVQNKKN